MSRIDGGAARIIQKVLRYHQQCQRDSILYVN
jgi:hypothetical protein